jgi:hypothetical protein
VGQQNKPIDVGTSLNASMDEKGVGNAKKLESVS